MTALVFLLALGHPVWARSPQRCGPIGPRAGRVAMTLVYNVNYPGDTLKSPSENYQKLAGALSPYGVVDVRLPERARIASGPGGTLVPVQNLSSDMLHDNFSLHSQNAAEAQVRIFYYTGHGLRIGNKDYLVPKDVDPADEKKVLEHGLDVQSVLDDFAAITPSPSGPCQPVNIIIMDACRNGPPDTKVDNDEGARLPANTILVYAVSPGETVPDAEDKDAHKTTPFTRALVEKARQQNIMEATDR